MFYLKLENDVSGSFTNKSTRWRHDKREILIVCNLSSLLCKARYMTNKNFENKIVQILK